MNFYKISEQTACNCFIDAVENTTDTFVRRVRRSNNLSDSDFKNHIERNKIPVNKDHCDEVCGLYGVSVELWSQESYKPLMDKYLTTAALSPQFKKNLSVIRFMPNDGLIKHTPNQEEYNEFHYDFYKEDTFSVNNLNLIEMIPLVVV